MADYSEAKYRFDSLVAQERSERRMNKITDEAADSRRIQANDFQQGGYVAPAGSISAGSISNGTTFIGYPPQQSSTKITQIATFESAGVDFTVAELRGALAKLNVSADATITFEPVDGEGDVNDATVATVQWTV